LVEFRQRYIPGIRPEEFEAVFVRHDEYPKRPDGKPDTSKEPRIAVHFHYAKVHIPSGKKKAPISGKRIGLA
jgi:hypothetical protein